MQQGEGGPFWTYESLAFNADSPVAGDCAPDRVPVIRLYNNGMGGQASHRYTTSRYEIAATLGRGGSSRARSSAPFPDLSRSHAVTSLPTRRAHSRDFAFGEGLVKRLWNALFYSLAGLRAAWDEPALRLESSLWSWRSRWRCGYRSAFSSGCC